MRASIREIVATIAFGTIVYRAQKGVIPYGEEKEEMQQDIRPTFGR
jgi:hypothetical protein